MTLERHHYGNPENIAMRNESKTCKGCKHTEIIWKVVRCLKGRMHGRRCKKYQEV